MPQSPYGNYGTGAQVGDILQDILAQRQLERIAAEKLAYERYQDAVKRAEENRRIGVTEGRLGLDTDIHGFEQTKWGDLAGQREATEAGTRATTENTLATAAKTRQGTGFEAEDRASTQGIINTLPDVGPDGQMSPRKVVELLRAGDIDLTTPGGQMALYGPTAMGTRAGVQAGAEWGPGGGKQRLIEETGIKTAGDIAVANARRQAEGTGTPGELSEYAGMIMNNPTLLDKLSPTERGRVLREIASSGEQFPNQRAETTRSLLQGARESLNQIVTKDPTGKIGLTPGAASAFGFPGWERGFGLTDVLGAGPVSGSQAAAAQRYVDRLKAQLTLPRLEFLRGLGAMSDREFKTIADSVTALDRALPDEAALQEILSLYQTLDAIEARIPGLNTSTGGGRTGGQSLTFDPTNPDWYKGGAAAGAAPGGGPKITIRR